MSGPYRVYWKERSGADSTMVASFSREAGALAYIRNAELHDPLGYDGAYEMVYMDWSLPESRWTEEMLRLAEEEGI